MCGQDNISRHSPVIDDYVVQVKKAGCLGARSTTRNLYIPSKYGGMKNDNLIVEAIKNGHSSIHAHTIAYIMARSRDWIKDS